MPTKYSVSDDAQFGRVVLFEEFPKPSLQEIVSAAAKEFPDTPLSDLVVRQSRWWTGHYYTCLRLRKIDIDSGN